MSNTCLFDGTVSGKINEVNNFIKALKVNDSDSIGFHRVGHIEFFDEYTEKNNKTINFAGECAWSVRISLIDENSIKNNITLKEFLEKNPSIELTINSQETDFTETFTIKNGKITEEVYDFKEIYLADMWAEKDINTQKEMFNEIIEDFEYEENLNFYDQINEYFKTNIKNFNDFKNKFKDEESIYLNDNPNT